MSFSSSGTPEGSSDSDSYVPPVPAPRQSKRNKPKSMRKAQDNPVDANSNLELRPLSNLPPTPKVRQPYFQCPSVPIATSRKFT